MRLAHQLVHLRVRGEVDDQVDFGVLDAVDATGERGVVPGEILQESREASPTHGFGRLSTPKTLWPSRCSRRARFVPIWPDEPVMRMRIG